MFLRKIIKKDGRSVHCNTGLYIPKLQMFFYIAAKTHFILRGFGGVVLYDGSKFCRMPIMTRERRHKISHL